MSVLGQYKYIIILIFLALSIRILLYLQIMDTTPFPDFFAYKEWVYKSYSLGLDKAYIVASNKIMDIDQPPGTILVLRTFYEIFLLVVRGFGHFIHLGADATTWIDSHILVFFLRFPSIIADIILGFLIYCVVRSKSSEKIALLAASFYLFSPPIIYNSTFWGQLDSINNLLFFVSLVFMYKKKALSSVLFFALSLFVKLSLLPLLPLYLLLGFSGFFFKRRSFSFSIVASILLIIILTLPFSSNPFFLNEILIKTTYGVSQEITVSAFNFWQMILNPGPIVPSSSTIYFGLSLSMWGYLIFGLLYLPIIYLTLKLILAKKFKTEYLFLFFSILAFAAFLFLPKMHERYLYPVFPLLITWIGLRNRYWIIAIILSILHFLNLYIVWNPDLYWFFKFEEGIKTQNFKWLLSFLTVCVFVLFYIKFVIYPVKRLNKR